MEFTLAKGHVSNAIHYDSCVTSPIAVPKIKVTKGRFRYDGTTSSLIGKFKVHVDGRFVTSTKAKGTWKVKKLGTGHCTSNFKYTAVRTGPARV